MRKVLTGQHMELIFNHLKDYVKTSSDPDDVKIKEILKLIYKFYHFTKYGKGATEVEIEKALEDIE